MKKIFIAFAIAIMCMACTPNEITRNYGGKTTINLEPGQRLVECTWKDNNIWILTEPMDSDYVPKTKKFTESSGWGCLEGEVTFIESK